MSSRASSIKRNAAFALLLALTSVRCAHTPKSPEEIACRNRVDRCMERCGGGAPEPPARPEQGQGCQSDSQSQCQSQCYEDCDWD